MKIESWKDSSVGVWGVRGKDMLNQTRLLPLIKAFPPTSKRELAILTINSLFNEVLV